MMNNFAVPPLWVPKANSHGRLIGLSAVKTITFPPGVQGFYVQAISQNVRVTLDGTTPVASGNDTGFQIRAGDPPVLILGQVGQVLSFIQEAATAVVQYQPVTLASRFSL